MLEVNITRNPSLASTTLISPIIFLSILSPTSLLLPSDDGSKLDIQINAMLAYAVYMMILSDYIPPFADDQRPAIGEANRKCWHLQLKPGLVWVDHANNN